MTGSRTIKVIFTLILAMTAGAIALSVMQTKPPPLSPLPELSAGFAPIDAEFETDVQIDANRWRHIVIHSTGAEGIDLLKRVHFIVDADGRQLVHATSLWKSQRQADHVRSAAHNYNADSIAIALRGDFSRQPPTRQQLLELVRLVRSLQSACDIDTSKVYPYRPDLNGSGARSPGKAFPMREFTQLLDKQ